MAVEVIHFLGKEPAALVASPDVADDEVEIESIDGTLYGKAPRSGLSFVLHAPAGRAIGPAGDADADLERSRPGGGDR